MHVSYAKWNKIYENQIEWAGIKKTHSLSWQKGLIMSIFIFRNTWWIIRLVISFKVDRYAKDKEYSPFNERQSLQDRELKSHKSFQRNIFFLLSPFSGRWGTLETHMPSNFQLQIAILAKFPRDLLPHIFQ